MESPKDIICNSEVLNRLFNGNVVTLTWDEFRVILNHFVDITMEQFNLISSNFDTVTVKLW